MHIKDLAEQQLDLAVRHRRWLHQHAELSWKEYETTDYICEQLLAIGLEPKCYPDHTGCSAVIEGGKNPGTGKTILLRADIDAMPGQDSKGVPYVSKNTGAVHSCGHDAHTAMLLCAAKILYSMRDELEGTIRLLFEAAEEIGTGGAYYVEQGILDGVDAAFSMHLWSYLDAPYINIDEGPRFSNFNIFHVTVHGYAEATMNPHIAGDALLAGSKVVENLQLLETRMNDPLDSTVVAVGTMHGGYAPNTYCEHMELSGTVRTFSTDFEEHLDQRFTDIVQDTVRMLRCSADVEIIHGCPAIIQDDEKMLNLTRNTAEKLFGPDVLQSLPPSLGSDTFGYYAAKVPGIYALLGCRNEEKGYTFPLHNDLFDFDETILPNGIALYVQTAIDFLKSSDK